VKRDRIGKGCSEFRTQGPRGLGLGSRNLATHPTNVALGEGPLFRVFVVFPCRSLLRHSACQLGLKCGIFARPNHKYFDVCDLGMGFADDPFIPLRKAAEKRPRWVGNYKGDCKNAIMDKAKGVRLAILASAGGTTLQNLLDRIGAGTLKAEAALVVSNNKDAYALVRARHARVETAVVSRKEAGEEFSRRIFDLCRQARVDLVCLAGFLQLIQVPDDFLGRIMNIHPALIPAFCGKGYYGHHVHEAVLAYGAKISGCTVHFVDNEYDHGPIILQRAVPVLDDDTPDTLGDRVFSEECAAYPEAIRLFGEGRLKIEGRRVRVLG
jgi:phosphoribosylglycinamide formyltransferase-1